MKQLVSAAGRAFLRAFAAATIAYATGILAAPDLGSARLLGLAALVAAIGAGIRSLQAYVPSLSFDAYLGADAGRYLDAFAQAFIGALCVSLPALLTYPSQSDWHALEASIVVAVLAALSRGVQALGTTSETVTSATGGGSGLAEPPKP